MSRQLYNRFNLDWCEETPGGDILLKCYYENKQLIIRYECYTDFGQ